MKVCTSRRVAALGLTSAALAATAFLGVAPANASPLASVAPAATNVTRAEDQNGRCEPGEFCLYYYDSRHGYGSVWDNSYSVDDLSSEEFISSGRGQNEAVTNNAEAYWNRTDYRVALCKDVDYSGGYFWAQAHGHRQNLPSSYKNNVESIYIDE